MATNWTKIKNDYLNGNISYRDLAKKHKVGYSALKARAVKEKWFDKRKEQRKKIEQKIGQKTAEKIADREANRIARVQDAADKLLEKIELATQQLDMFLATDKRKYSKSVVDNATGKNIKVYVEEEVPKSVKLSHTDTQKLKQLTSALKDLRDIQYVKNEDTTTDDKAGINITISAATLEDAEVDE